MELIHSIDKRKVIKYTLIFLAIVAIYFFVTSSAFAAAQNLPWEGPLDKVKKSITGPVAGAISLMGVVVAGCMLIWGGEMSEFTRRIVMLVFVIALILGAASIIGLFSAKAGALIY